MEAPRVKAEQKKKIIQCMVEVVIEKKYENATLREIAQRAEISNDTLFKQFPNKRAIVFAYFEQKLRDTLDMLAEDESFDNYDLEEKLITLFETNLILMRPDREFFQESYKAFLESPISSFNGILSWQNIIKETVEDYIQLSPKSEILRKNPLFTVIPFFIPSFYQVVLVFWINDESQNYHRTSQFIRFCLKVFMNIMEKKWLFDSINLEEVPFSDYFSWLFSLGNMFNFPGNPGNPGAPGAFGAFGSFNAPGSHGFKDFFPG